jgi:hypothetical protein
VNPGYNYNSDLLFAVGLFAGWLALVIALSWHPIHRCRYPVCPHKNERK